MKDCILRLLAGCLLVLPLLSVACASGTETDNVSPFANETERQRWEERGLANLKSISAAEELTGFPIAEPGYLPDGFTFRGVNVIASGAGMPEERKPEFDATKVEQFYFWGEEKTDMFFLIQFQHKFGIGGGEPYQLNGRPAERSYIEGNVTQPPKLSFAWELDGKGFSIMGYLAGPLDEATLVKIASSVAFKQ